MTSVIQFLKDYKDSYIKFLAAFIILIFVILLIMYLFKDARFYINCERNEIANNNLCSYQTNLPGKTEIKTFPVNELLKAEYSTLYMPSKGCIVLKTTKTNIALGCLKDFKKHEPKDMLNQINNFIHNKQFKNVRIYCNPGEESVILYGIAVLLIFFIKLFMNLKKDIKEFKSDYEDEKRYQHEYKDELKDCSGDINEMINKGFHLIELRSYKNAERVFRSVLSIDPHSSPGLLGLARCHYSENKIDSALKIAKQALSQDPQNYYAFKLLSEIYGSTNLHYEKAIEYGLKALELWPDNASTHAWLAQIYCFNKQFKLCYYHAQEALKLDPGLDIAYLALALYHNERNDFDKAKECYEKALEISPNCDVILNNLAALYINNGRYKEAYGLMRTVLMINPQKELFQENFKLSYIRSHQLYKPLAWMRFERFGFLYLSLFIISLFAPIVICITAPFLLFSIYALTVITLLKSQYNSALKNGTLARLIDKE